MLWAIGRSTLYFPAGLLARLSPEQLRLARNEIYARRGRFFRDLESYFLAARLQERYIPSSRRLRPVAISHGRLSLVS